MNKDLIVSRRCGRDAAGIANSLCSVDPIAIGLVQHKRAWQRKPY